MIYNKLPTGGNQITVPTGSSSSLLDLIRTAISDPSWQFPAGTNAIYLNPQDGDVRYLLDGNDVDTDTGFILLQNTISGDPFKGIDPNKVQLTSDLASAVKASVMVGQVDKNLF